METMTQQTTTPSPLAMAKYSKPLRTVHKLAGVIAVAVKRNGVLEMTDEHKAHRPVIEAAIAFLDKTGQKHARAVYGGITLVVKHQGEAFYVVMLPTGHGSSKSLLRTIKRAEKRAAVNV